MLVDNDDCDFKTIIFDDDDEELKFSDTESDDDDEIFSDEYIDDQDDGIEVDVSDNISLRPSLNSQTTLVNMPTSAATPIPRNNSLYVN